MNNNWEYDYSELYNKKNEPANMQGNGMNGSPASYPGAPDHGGSETSFMEPPKKNKNGKRILALVLAVLICIGAGFGGGWLGYYAARGTAGNAPVIYQAPAVQTDHSGTGSTPGAPVSVKDIAKRVGPSVVEVSTEAVQMHPIFGQFVMGGAGSGVIITEDGYIITNNHVVEGATQVKIRLTDGTEYQAEVIGTDPKTDVAVIKIDASGLTPAVIGDSDALEVGEFAMAVGNPLGQLGGTVTDGIISALDREVQVENESMHLLQTNAAISPGNSGGGLFNERGELIGIVNAKSGGNNTEGLGFAIPVNTAIRVAKDLMDTGYVTGRPAMGIMVVDLTDPQRMYQYGVSQAGVYVQSVNEGGAAEKAGMKPGDRFISVDGTVVAEMSDITSVLGAHTVGETIEVQVVRGKQLISMNVVLEEKMPEKKSITG